MQLIVTSGVKHYQFGRSHLIHMYLDGQMCYLSIHYVHYDLDMLHD